MTPVLAIVSAIVLVGVAAVVPAAAGQPRAYAAVAVPDCGTILDDCVPACDWRVPDGGWPLAACYNNICYRQAGACEASRIPRPGGNRSRVRASAGSK